MNFKFQKIIISLHDIIFMQWLIHGMFFGRGIKFLSVVWRAEILPLHNITSVVQLCEDTMSVPSHWQCYTFLESLIIDYKICPFSCLFFQTLIWCNDKNKQTITLKTHWTSSVFQPCSNHRLCVYQPVCQPYPGCWLEDNPKAAQFTPN